MTLCTRPECQTTAGCKCVGTKTYGFDTFRRPGILSVTVGEETVTLDLLFPRQKFADDKARITELLERFKMTDLPTLLRNAVKKEFSIPLDREPDIHDRSFLETCDDLRLKAADEIERLQKELDNLILDCPRCHGRGKIRNLATLSPTDDVECPECGGKGGFDL